MGCRVTATWATAAVVAVGGCGDEIVGYFEDSIASVGMSGSGESGTTAAESSTSVAAPSTSDGGDGGFVAPGCFGDDFENAAIDALWNTWIEEDALLEEVGGMLKLTPPTYGIFDTGVVGAYNYVFPFTTGHARLRVPAPPDPARQVVLFLTVGDDAGVAVSMQLSGGVVSIAGSIDLVDQYREEFPVATYPAWIQIRAEGPLVHYETSDDGATFTTLTTRDKISAFPIASALIMAQTWGEDFDRSMVGVDDFEVCVE